MIPSSVNSFRTHLRTAYGKQTQAVSADYGKCLEKLARFKNHVVFSARCKKERVIPPSLQIRAPINTQRGREIAAKASRSFLNERLRVANQRVRELQNEQKWREIGLRRSLGEEDYQKVTSLCEQHAEKVFQRTRDNQRAKFDRWTRRVEPSQGNQEKFKERWVVNLSDQKLSDEQESVLQKGLNFAKTPGTIPQTEIIASVEASLRSCKEDPDKVEHVRACVARALKNADRLRPNTTTDERAALKSLKENKNITIVPADKGNTTVIINTADYEKKASEILNNPPFKQLTSDPTARNEKRVNAKVKELWERKRITSDVAQRLRVPEKSTRPPLFYGSVKVHKKDYPLRPIVSTIGSPAYKVSAFVSEILRTYVRQADSYIENTRDFLELLREVHVTEDEVMVSFDIKSLFTSVPTQEARAAIDFQLKMDHDLEERTGLSADTINELIELCFAIRDLRFREKHYELSDGLAMGAPASPAIANIYMASLEKRALETWNGTKPKTWYRFVDDIFSIVKQSQVNDFLKHLNEQHPSIRFTMELEKDKKLPFLDVTVHRTGETLTTTVYRKPTHSGRYLNFSSHHPPSAKRSVVQALHHRLEYITTSEDDREKEKELIKRELKQNGYTDAFIRGALKKRKQRKETTDDQEKKFTGTATIPYIEGLSERIRRILAQVGIRTALSARRIKWSLMDGAKDRIPAGKQAGVIYALGCKSCTDVYVGETARTAEQRSKEHRMHARTGNTHLSAVAAHTTTGHEIHWQPMVLAREHHNTKRKVLEALYIHKLNKRTINQDSGMKLSKLWLELVSRKS